MSQGRSRSLKQRLAVTAALSALLFGASARVAPSNAHGAAAHRSASNTLTIGWAVETKTLDPVNSPQNPDIWVMVNIYDQLLRVGPNGTTLEPDLATSWNITNGGKVYTFHLRHNVKFQNGMKFSASDVKFALDRARQKSELWSWTLAAIKNVAAVNPYTVRVTLKHPWAPFLSDVSLFDTGIYPKAYFQKVGKSYMSSHPVGTGPYGFQQWKRGQFLRLKKNPNYWLASKYPMQYVEYDLIPNDNTRLLKLQAGELDVDNALPYNQIPELQRSTSAAVVINKSTETNYIVPNDKATPFKDKYVRQAVNHAIDRAALVKAILLGHGEPANSFMPKGAIDWDPNIPVPSHNMALAKSLLKKSKYPHGFTMQMETGSGDSIGNEEAIILKSEVAPLGIKLNIRQIDPTTLFNNQQEGKYHMSTNLWTNDIPDPDELVSFSVDYTQGSKAFYTWYDNKQMANLSHQAEQSNSPSQRRQLYYKIQQLWAQNVPFFALYYSPFVNGVSKDVHGFSENPLGYFNLQGVHK